jgi:P4 family phage/plasmid primase-like protien
LFNLILGIPKNPQTAGETVLSQLKELVKQKGYDLDAETFTLDGEIHHISTPKHKLWYAGKTYKTKKDQSYATLTFGDFRSGKRFNVSTDKSKISKEEFSRIEEEQRQEKERIEEELGNRQEKVAERSQKEWRGFETTSTISRYSQKKKIGEYIKDGSLLGAKIIRDGSIIVPMKDIDGKLWGYQTIDPEGQKLYLPHQKVQGCFFLLGEYNPKGVVYICEGFATGVSIHVSSGKTTAVAFSADGLKHIGDAFRNDSPSCSLVFCGDEDQWKLGRGGRPHHTGRRAAKQAASLTQGSICQVSFGDIDADKLSRVRPTDFNDLHVLSGIQRVAEQIKDHYETHPTEYITTEHTGFHEETWTKTGPKHEPKPVDLYKFYQRFGTLRGSEGKIFNYSGGVYSEISPHILKAFSQEHYRINEEKVANRYLRDEFVATAQTEANVAMSWWDHSTEGYVNFKNGLFNKDTEELEPHCPEKGFKFQLDYDYDAYASCPTWDLMLQTITQSNEKLANLLEEYVGYSLSNDPIWEHKALMLVGDGSNGKSTFIETVGKLIGTENFASVSVSGLSSETRRDMIHGKLAILCEENNIKNFDSDHFKNIVSGGWTDARALYQNPYQFRNRAKMIVAFNNFDRVQDLSHGLFRRLILAPFKHTFKDGEADKLIENKLSEELSGIFNKCWDAYKRMKTRGGFEEVQVIQEALEELRLESDNLMQFADENLAYSNGSWTEPKSRDGVPNWAGWDSTGCFIWLPELYAEYKFWCDAAGYKPFGRVKFTRGLRRVFSARGVEIEEPFVKKRDRRCVKALRGLTFQGFSEF